MKAAVVYSFEAPPVVAEFDAPVARDGEVLVRVDAAALSQLARGQAAGTHYSSGTLPFVPGADGVGWTENGQRVYFAFPRAPWGSMGEFTTVRKDHLVALPAYIDSVAFAALANPAMSSWAALSRRAGLVRGETVLINGANGASGRLAIRISRILGASRVVVTARSESARAELLALGADAFICLAQGREQVVAEVSREAVEGVDVVLDYLWGHPAEWVLEGVASAAKHARPHRVRFVNVGALAGPSMTLAPSTLRSAPIELSGSGLGSLPTSTLVDAVADIVAALETESLHIPVTGLSIDGVSEYWRTDTKSRLVFTF